MAEGTTFTMTAEHLARTMEGARQREREKIARYLDEQADVCLSQDGTMGGSPSSSTALREAAEYVRSMGQATAAPPVAVSDPLDAMRDVPAGSEELPPVRHMDDFDEGVAIVRNLGARGKLNV